MFETACNELKIVEKAFEKYRAEIVDYYQTAKGQKYGIKKG